MFNVLENIDPFKIMKLLGVHDRLYCIDLIQGARNAVLEARQAKGQANG